MLIDEVSQFDVYDPSEVTMFPLLSKKLRDISRSELDPNCHLSHWDTHHCAGSGPINLVYPELNNLMVNPQPLRLIFHLINVLSPDEYKHDNWQLNDDEKLLSLENLRSEGNRLFSEKKYNDAAERYKEAIDIIDKLLLKEKPNSPEWLRLDNKNVAFYLNLSQCFLNLEKFYQAAECASEALKRDQNNEKALFRRIKARISTWDFEIAESDLNHLEKISPNSQSLIISLKKEISDKRLQKIDGDRVVCKAMFNV